MKAELIKSRGPRDQNESRQEIFEYAELYNNTKRLHSCFGI